MNQSFPNAYDLKCFQEIARTLNLSRAAERLGVGQPALSLCLKRLERSLEAQLFLRRNKGLVLTPAGQKLLNSSHRLLEEWNRVITETQHTSNGFSGHFRMGCHTALALFVLTPLVSRLAHEYPDIHLQLTHGLSRKMCEAVILGNLDFAFAVNPVHHPDLVIRKIAEDQFCFWAIERQNCDLLIYDPNLDQSRLLLKSDGSHFRRHLHSSSLEVICSFAQAGIGTALLPSRVARQLAPLAKRRGEFASVKDEIALVYRYDLYKTAAAEAIISIANSLEC